jgi:membrane protein required for colicin V production
VTAFVLGRIALPPSEAWIPLFVVFIAIGFVLGSLIRKFVKEIVGPEPGLFDRVAGAVLGAVRIFLVAVLVVVAFDRIIPTDRQPPFLVGSRLRPYLSAAGQKGLQSLPPDVEDYIDRLKRERGL